MISGIADHQNIVIDIIDNSKKVYLILFDTNLKSWNFRENIFILLINNALNVIVEVIKNILLLYTLYILMCIIFSGNCIAMGMEAVNNASAGVGSPKNSVFWSVMLNIARRIAEKSIIIIDRNGRIVLFDVFCSSLSIMKVGASPKLTTSDRESYCLPNSDVAFNKRAVNPSKKSKIAAIRIIIPDKYSFSGYVKAK